MRFFECVDSFRKYGTAGGEAKKAPTAREVISLSEDLMKRRSDEAAKEKAKLAESSRGTNPVIYG